LRRAAEDHVPRPLLHAASPNARPQRRGSGDRIEGGHRIAPTLVQARRRPSAAMVDDHGQGCVRVLVVGKAEHTHASSPGSSWSARARIRHGSRQRSKAEGERTRKEGADPARIDSSPALGQTRANVWRTWLYTTT